MKLNCPFVPIKDSPEHSLNPHYCLIKKGRNNFLPFLKKYKHLAKDSCDRRSFSSLRLPSNNHDKRVASLGRSENDPPSKGTTSTLQTSPNRQGFPNPVFQRYHWSGNQSKTKPPTEASSANHSVKELNSEVGGWHGLWGFNYCFFTPSTL